MAHIHTGYDEVVREMIGRVINDPAQEDYVLHQVSAEGPKHKQELSALLIGRIAKLVSLTEQRSGTGFEMLDGFEFTTGKEDVPVLPILMPIITGNDEDPQVSADHIAQAPEHELLALSVCLQGIEWVIKQTENGL